jgi:hypothetical protein
MSDEEDILAQAAALPHLYFDGYVCYRKQNGVLRCVAHVAKVPQYNIITSLAGADQANRDTRRVLDTKASTTGWLGRRTH